MLDTILELAEKWRAAAHWDRSDSRNALLKVKDTVFSLFQGQEDHDPEELKKEAGEIREKIRERLPDDGECSEENPGKADLLFKLCQHCAWHEQNKVDYDDCVLDKVSGAADGYKEASDKDYHEMELTAYRLGFD